MTLHEKNNPRVFCIRIASIIIFYSFQSYSQPQLLKEVNNSDQFTAGSSPDNIFSLNEEVYFRALSHTFGHELFMSDGTSSGTRLVKDINPQGSSSPMSFSSINNILYFSAHTPEYGRELWKTDGTEAGTSLIKDIVPGNTGAEVNLLVNANGILFFTATTPALGRELWKSDRTEAGTVLVSDIIPGTGSGFTFSSEMVGIGDLVFFTLDDGVNGLELWKSDGTESGTLLVKDIAVGAASTEFFYLRAVNNVLYFTAEDMPGNQELWKSDGTEVGTVIVENIPGGNKSAGPVTFFKDRIYFGSFTPSDGYELWSSDGSESGTVLVKDINPGPEGSMYGNITVMGEHIYFSANDGINGHQLWKSDGTAEGTVMVEVINPGGDFPLDNFFVVNNTLFFRGGESNGVDLNLELWKSDGTAEGTVRVKDIHPNAPSNPMYLNQANGVLIFGADDGISGDELWRSDGTEAGTFQLADINTAARFSPTNLSIHDNNLYFVNNQSPSSYEIWKSDGTSVGTTLVKDILPGSVRYLYNITNVNGTLFFTLDDGLHGYEMWRSDGTEEGTYLLKDILPGINGSAAAANLAPIPNSNGMAYFSADDGINGEGLWKSDGTEAGTVKLNDLNTLLGTYNTFMVGSTLYFFKQHELWKSDGTSEGTELVKVINTTTSGWSAGYFFDNNGVFYFAGDDGVHGLELWKSDGTEAGTMMIKDIIPHKTFPNSSLTVGYTYILGVVDGVVFFSQYDGTHGHELWKSDGTEEGTVLIKDIWPGPNTGNLGNIINVGSTIFFTANDGVHGTELWKTDGTEEGTVLIKDINSSGSSISSFYSYNSISFNDILFFTADDGIHGFELWRSDGTTEGTYLVSDVSPGKYSSFPGEMEASEDYLFFIANDGVHGSEIWKFDPTYQTIYFDVIPDKVATDAPFEITATAFSGLPVIFTVVAGPATINGNTVTLTGSGMVTIRASQPGNEIIKAAEDVDRSFSVVKASQIITFESIGDKKSTDAPFPLVASASSDLPVSFSVASGPASVSDDMLTITGGGQITISAFQDGDSRYEPAETVIQSFNVELVVGIEQSSMTAVQAYPNPATETLTIFLQESVYNLILINRNGQRVWQFNPSSENPIELSVSEFPKGLYLLKTEKKNETETVKIQIK